jgi:hypothetical protein
MTTDEMATRFHVKPITLQVWARKNDVARLIGWGGIAAYDWTEADCARFVKRRGKDRPRKAE